MTVVVYKSTDTSAPVLTGQVGAATALLKACLVNGYGSQPAAGWSNPYSGTNSETFRPGSGVQHYFHVNDNAPVVASESRLQGSETASAFGTGTGFFPPTNLGLVKKSSTADGTARAWWVVADDRTCWVMVQWLAAVANYGLLGFGEVFSYLTSDGYRSFVLSGKTTENNNTASDDTPITGSNTRSAVARASTGLGTAQRIGIPNLSIVGGKFGSTGAATTALFPFPNPPDGGLYINKLPIWEIDPSTSAPKIRGLYRGVFGTIHQAASFALADTFDGVGEYQGRSFVFGPTHHLGGDRIVFETTDWPASV